VGQSLKTADIWRWSRKSENPHFLETDEFWSTYGDTFEKPSGRATWPQNFVGQSSKTAKIWRWRRKPGNPHFLETDELWSTYFDTFGKTLGRAAWHQNFAGQSSKTAEIWRWERKTKNPHFFKIGERYRNFVFSVFRDCRPLSVCQIWKESVRKWRVQSSKTAEIWRWGLKSENPHFSKLMNYGPHILTLLESSRERLHVTKILWAKVQKRRRYRVGGQNKETPHYLENELDDPHQSWVRSLKGITLDVLTKSEKTLSSENTLNGGDMAMREKSVNPHFLEIGELWSTYCDTVGKPSGRATWLPKFCGPMFKNGGDMALGQKTKTPTFSKLIKFGPHIVTLLESPRAGLHVTKILWAKVQKRRRYDGGAKIEKKPFLETGELWSTYVDTFGKPSGGLLVTKILWTKVQKRRRYRVGAKYGKPQFSRGSSVAIFTKFWHTLKGTSINVLA